MGKFQKTSSLSKLGILLFFISSARGSQDTLLSSDKISKEQSLTSANNKYRLGFFSPSPNNPNKTYLGIWFTVDPSKPVWVANRETPLTNPSIFLSIDQSNRLILSNGRDEIWAAGEETEVKVSLQLLDNGNLVLQRADGVISWQSFDHPSDTLLPEMKLGVNRRTGQIFNLTSWAAEDDPAQGPYSYSLDTHGVVQPFLRNKHKDSILYRSGPWKGTGWSGNQRMVSYKNYTFSLVETQDEVFFQFNVTKSSTLSRLVVDDSGLLRRLEWIDNERRWNELWKTENGCDEYAKCGPNGYCTPESVPCKCLQGYKPRNDESWGKQSWAEGCEKMSRNKCAGGDVFQEVCSVKLPDTVNATKNDDFNADQCKELCLGDCRCTAYAQAFENGSRCIVWTGDLVDSRTFSEGQQTLFVRVAPHEYVSSPCKESKVSPGRSLTTPTGKIVGITLGVALALFVFIVCTYLNWRSKFQKKKKIGVEEGSRIHPIKSLPYDDSGLTLFDLGTIILATNNFSITNRIGRGGSGDVYKGVMEIGKEVAIKRLSSTSGEGISEFTTEVRLIAKLQHRNLVRLLGCCIEGEERLLIYEHMANGSLDYYIFGDRQKRMLLNWEQRLRILLGVAKGLQYLHQDSRLRVIHRDLKAANILLDEEMNPKISDFGTARIFEREQMEDNTMKIVGTLGYISPEYLMTGSYSEKSDIFSFGVLVLEVISGRRNQLKNTHMPLLGHAWSLWAEGQSHAMLDSTEVLPVGLYDLERFTKVALLCVQECPEDRPFMSQVVFMLSNNTAEIPDPEKPGFFQPCQAGVAALWFSNQGDLSRSMDVTMTCIQGR